jgi:hypothetical protein
MVIEDDSCPQAHNVQMAHKPGNVFVRYVHKPQNATLPARTHARSAR